MFSVYTDCFFFNDTATTEIYTLSLHDALPILFRGRARAAAHRLEPSRLASSIRLLRSGAEPDSAQSPPRPSPGAAMRRGIRAVSRDAACQASHAALGLHAGFPFARVSRRRKALPGIRPRPPHPRPPRPRRRFADGI